jgi:K+-dependent Na+/Ca+ exchanger related-protein
MITNIFFLVLGFIVLIRCADYFVDGATSLAKHLKVPATIIGLTVVAFCTSAPEMSIAFNSHMQGNADMIIGNIIASNILNIMLIIGIGGVIHSMKVGNGAVEKELPMLLLITTIFAVLFSDSFITNEAVNTISRADGIVLILLFSIFVYYLIAIIAHRHDVKEREIKEKFGPAMAVFMTLLGLVGIIFGSNVVVTCATEFAVAIGISQKIIAMTIVAIGTSLPELVTTIVAVRKNEVALALGNIVGTNIFNTCIALGLPVVILGPISISTFNMLDIFMMIFAALILMFFASTNREISRREAIAMLFIFVAYYATLFVL